MKSGSRIASSLIFLMKEIFLKGKKQQSLPLGNEKSSVPVVWANADAGETWRVVATVTTEST